MIGYIKRDNMLSRIKDEVDLNWNMQKHYGELAEGLKDADSVHRYLDMQLQYIHRWEESVRLYNILAQTK